MMNDTQLALDAFTQHFVTEWQKAHGCDPTSIDLNDIPSPCITKNADEKVYWLPVKSKDNNELSNIEQALNVKIHEDVHSFYTFQYAGDMAAHFWDMPISLIQAWSPDDFVRLQENILGHLFMQRRLKLPYTVFIATVESDLDVISVCNTTGEVTLERIGTKERKVLASSLSEFLKQLHVSF